VKQTAAGPITRLCGVLKLRIPTKLGFKNPKWITAMYVTNRFPGSFWEDRGYNWFAGV
jgi:DMSO/TMAO reductase YedYZ molybdopterin-dependent catalytic subunit